MSISIKNLERLQQLHLLIEDEQTGSPKELARRMYISERLVYNLIDRLKDYKASICYDRSRKTYYYYDDFRFTVNISVLIVSKNETTEIFDGSYLK
ncbi:DNA-binding protein [Maribacter sp. MJ134]|uniref:HTH domain-containing protein n=1 Tax=Maribacter sp. MJ134 TaxID=2496865 RepID=UPI000F829862|nr:HTH domain-containing protein [Maribacter sp. MJ134]AZQ59886.1 DNA-binding protein [Maribacter sp. MJ134]